MTPRRIYYINYIDKETGFLKREEFDRHRDQTTRISKLKAEGVTHITPGSYEKP